MVKGKVQALTKIERDIDYIYESTDNQISFVAVIFEVYIHEYFEDLRFIRAFIGEPLDQAKNPVPFKSLRTKDFNALADCYRSLECDLESNKEKWLEELKQAFEDQQKLDQEESGRE